MSSFFNQLKKFENDDYTIMQIIETQEIDDFTDIEHIDTQLIDSKKRD